MYQSFILTYFVCTKETKDRFEALNRYAIMGSITAIFDLYFHLTKLQELHKIGKHPSACPMFIEVRDLQGNLQDMTKGINGMSSIGTFE